VKSVWKRWRLYFCWCPPPPDKWSRLSRPSIFCKKRKWKCRMDGTRRRCFFHHICRTRIIKWMWYNYFKLKNFFFIISDGFRTIKINYSCHLFTRSKIRFHNTSVLVQIANAYYTFPLPERTCFLNMDRNPDDTWAYPYLNNTWDLSRFQPFELLCIILYGFIYSSRFSSWLIFFFLFLPCYK